MAILEELSFKQQKFCEEYLLSFNAYRAAVAAGYSENTALKGDLLHVPKIQAYLKAAMSRSAARAELTHDMLLRELMKIAFCNMGNYYDDYGLPKKMHQLTDEEKAAVSYYQRADMCYQDGHIFGELVKIKLHNKMAALDRLCKHTGFYKANWKPLPEVDRTETAEDIAFEAEHGQTRPSAAFTQEVSDELYAQLLERDGDKMRAAGWYMGETVVEKSDAGSQMLDVGGQSSDDDGVFSVVGDPDSYRDTNNGVGDVEDGSPECEVGSSCLSGRRAESEIAVADSDSGLPVAVKDTPLRLPNEGRDRLSQEGNSIELNQDLSDEKILTFSPPQQSSGSSEKLQVDVDGEKIPTFSPRAKTESRAESQESRVPIAI